MSDHASSNALQIYFIIITLFFFTFFLNDTENTHEVQNDGKYHS